MSGPLAGLTVLECPDGVATRYCGRLFTAHGATVLQAGPPDATGVGYGGSASAAYAAWLDHGKRPVARDLGQALGQAVDLVIAGQGPADVAAVDAALGAAGASNAIRLGLTWFAPDGPYAGWGGTDAVIQAMSGVAYATGPKDGAPMLPRGHAPQVVGGATAFIVAMAALIGRDAGWRGRRIDVNILDANLCFSEGGAAGLALTGDKVVRRGVNRFTPTFPGGIYQASDGWIGVTALTPPQWTALCDMIGHSELARDPASLVTLQRLNAADAFDRVLVPAFKTRPAAYWLTEGQGRRIPLAPVPDLAALPRTPHWQGRGSFAPVPGTASAVGPTQPFRIDSFLPPEGEGAPKGRKGDVGTESVTADGTESVATSPFRRSAPPSPSGGRIKSQAAATAPDLPLRGVRVLDLTMGWAGPLATRHFADLGADIVKVESCTHFDWWRAFDGPMDGDPPPYETRPSFLMVNRNKRGITLDLKTDAGKALVRRLAARADIMIENYAPGTLDKLGIGPKALAGATPGLIGISMGAFGAAGPWSGFRAYGSTVEQASGLPFVNGEPDDPPTMQHVAYGDPIGGLYGAVACLVALYGRRRGRGGAVIDLSQVECLFQLCADAIVAQSTQTDLLVRSGSHHPLSLLRAVAGTAAPETWIAVAAETAAQWMALAELIGCPELAPAKENEPDMEARLRAWAASREARDAVDRLQGAGVPAGPVYAAQDLLADPQLVAAGFWRRAERRFIGTHITPLAPYRLDGRPPPLVCASPTLGEHNGPVLMGELGLSRNEFAALEADGVIGTRAVMGSLQ
ncbi:CaiB/BaiF CoA-transferase family protein [Vineibacter terrae]|uniref:CaiB/BaiF CoA-transferase family protein n=1 Tax=Vineibacter terrae TaxID=2586908 RepID=UPI002E369A7D|nr:CoA transferase [Vineibacter terrae]HEX2890819.1 CoA transferase [Vineibacter terrae]